MSATNKTPNYDLPLYVANDKPTYLGDWNSTMNKLDAAIDEARDSGGAATEVVNALGLETEEEAVEFAQKVENSQSASQVQGIINANVNGYQTAEQVQAAIAASGGAGYETGELHVTWADINDYESYYSFMTNTFRNADGEAVFSLPSSENDFDGICYLFLGSTTSTDFFRFCTMYTVSYDRITFTYNSNWTYSNVYFKAAWTKGCTKPRFVVFTDGVLSNATVGYVNNLLTSSTGFSFFTFRERNLMSKVGLMHTEVTISGKQYTAYWCEFDSSNYSMYGDNLTNIANGSVTRFGVSQKIARPAIGVYHVDFIIEANNTMNLNSMIQVGFGRYKTSASDLGLNELYTTSPWLQFSSNVSLAGKSFTVTIPLPELPTTNTYDIQMTPVFCVPSGASLYPNIDGFIISM